MIFFFHWSFIDQALNTPTLVIICSLLLFCVTGWKTWTSRYDPPAFILLPNYTRPQNIVDVEPYFVSNLSDYMIKKSLTSSWRETEIQVTLRVTRLGGGGGGSLHKLLKHQDAGAASITCPSSGHQTSRHDTSSPAAEWRGCEETFDLQSTRPARETFTSCGM